jgi:hypothetical protein
MLLVVFLLAFLATKTCAARDDEVSFEEAETIAREEVDFEPEAVVVRPVQRGGLNPYLVWAVSLSTTNAAGFRVECATVEVVAATGEAEMKPC